VKKYHNFVLYSGKSTKLFFKIFCLHLQALMGH